VWVKPEEHPELPEGPADVRESVEAGGTLAVRRPARAPWCECSRRRRRPGRRGALSGRARAGQSAVQELDDYVYRSFTANDKTFSFLTLGEAPLKRALRLDARRKGVALGAPYSSFVDLAEEFKSMYPRLAASAESLAKVADALDVPLSAGAARGLPFCKDVAAVLVKMAEDGAAFGSTVGDARPPPSSLPY
jgi:hypothetical protein